MSHYNEDNEENENMNEKEEEKGFETVPIEETHNKIEVYNVYNGLDLSNNKCKRRIYNVIIIIFVIAIFFILKKILNLGQAFWGQDQSNYEYNYNKQNVKPYDKYNDYYRYIDDSRKDKPFYFIQKKDEINFKDFASPQLRKPKNIKLVEKLEISLDLEFDKFIHLKIKDADNKRWKVPEEDILNKDYFSYRNDNKIGISKSDTVVSSPYYFYVEILSKDNGKKNVSYEEKVFEKVNDINKDIGNNDKNKSNQNNEKDMAEEFGFRLVNMEDKEFYSFTTTKNFLFSDTYINFESKLTSDNIYGFGERTHDFKLNEGIYTIWPNDCGGTNYDDGKGGMNQYSHQPIGLHKTKYNDIWLGFVFLNTNAQDVIINSDESKNNTYLTHKTIGGIIDYYIIVGESPEEVLKNIQFLLGIPKLPPFWSFGYHQSSYYKSFIDFKNIYEKYKTLEIPIDSMWMDINSLENLEVFTINEHFKDIIPYIEYNIHKDGAKFISKVEIGFSYENKNSSYIQLGEELDIFIKSNYTKKNLIGKLRSGKTVFPDFFHPNIKQFWNKNLEDYYNLIKYDGIWLDMNEPANLLENKNTKCLSEIANENDCTSEKNKYDNEELPYMPGYRKNIKEFLSLKSISENALVYGNNTIYDIKPMISYYQTEYTYNFLNTNLNIRPFILSRSTSLGSGKFTFHWLGENLSTFDNLKNSISGIFNFNIFGMPFTGADICGFLKDASKNLCIRWYNLGIFYPFSRNHNFFDTKDQYPWSFDNEAIDIIKNNINLRYSLLRYMYSQFFLISLNEKGSFFKPLMFEFPEDEASYKDIESKIMFGEAFLICAFYDHNENSKEFEFPDAHFNIYPSGKPFNNYKEDPNSKNNIFELSGKLDKIHIFLRGGFIIPYQSTSDKYILNSQGIRNEKINLIVNIDQFNSSKGEIFYDNDEINTIKNKTYYRVDMFYNEKRLTFRTFKGYLDKYEYNDHILGKIEFWRINQIFEMNDKKENKTKNINLNITYNMKDHVMDIIEGIFDQENNKIIFEMPKDEKNISIFDIEEIELI